jgi:hypothetical protein
MGNLKQSSRVLTARKLLPCRAMRLLFLLSVGHSVYMLLSCASHGRTRCSLLRPHRPSAHALTMVGETSTLAQPEYRQQ